MKYLLIVILFISSLFFASNNDTKVFFGSVQIGDSTIAVQYVDSNLLKAGNVLTFHLFQENKSRYFIMNEEKIFLAKESKKDKHDLLGYLSMNYVLPQKPPGTLPIIYVAFLLDKSGNIIHRGISRGSTNKQYETQIFKLIKSFPNKLDVKVVNGKHEFSIKIIRITFYDF